MQRIAKITLLACSFFLFHSVYGQDTLAYWSFNETKGNAVYEKISGKNFPVQTARAEVEFVKGFSGNGIRTDGNSTFLKGPLNIPSIPVYVSGWFALETYPTDTAGFFSLYDSLQEVAVTVAVNTYGTPVIGIKTKNGFSYHGAEAKKISKFKWLKIGLRVGAENLQLFCNGEIMLEVAVKNTGLQFTHITIGRDERMKYVHIFPTSYINGIIDEVVIRKDLSTVALKASEITQSKQLPQLAIPSLRFKKDYNRPLYHLLPAANWTNETHGLIYYKNRYHIFNQKNGTNVFLGQINWGHFNSTDLVHWKEHIPVLTPEPGYDEYGIWSGHVVMHDNKPAILYSAGSAKSYNTGLAFPRDKDLIHWEKYPGNPVIKGQPEGFKRTDPHDPYLWKEGNTWYMVIGYGVIENEVQKGSLLLYRSSDLKHWTFLHTLFTGDPVNDDSGVFWEMPLVFKQNGKYVLLVNKVPTRESPAVALYWTGDFVNERFIPSNKIPKRLEIVNRLLSPSIYPDEKGRLTAIAIIPDETSAEAQFRQGWTHLYSIPRIWTMKEDKIIQQPHPNLKTLRGKKKTILNKIIEADSTLQIFEGQRQLEFELEIEAKNSEKFGFVIAMDREGKEFTRIYYDFKTQQMVVDQTKSSLQPGIPLNVRTGKYLLNQDQKIRFHVFIDGSVAEVFINGEDAFTTRYFPLNASGNRIELFTEGGPVKLVKADIWELKSAGLTADFKN